MAFLGHTTTLTTEGLKTFEELENTPFTAILNGNTFPCYEGTVRENNRDVYYFKASSMFEAYLTLDQNLLSKEGQLKNVQEFKFKDPLQIVRNSFYPYTGYENDIELLREAFQRNHYILNDMLIINFPPEAPVVEIRNMILRLGILTHTTTLPAAIKITKEYYPYFLDILDGNTLEQPINKTNITFKKLEYYDTLPTYSCTIEGARAIDAGCFYAKDNNNS